MALSDQLNRDLIEAIADNPVTFTWSGTDYTGTWGPLTHGNPLVTGGFLDDPEVTLVTSMKKYDTDGSTLVSRFTSDTPPDANAKLTINSVIYRIKERTFDDFSVAVVFTLENNAAG